MLRRPTGSRLRFGTPCLALLVAALSCTESPPEEEVIEAGSGPVQPSTSADEAPLVDARVACDRLLTALTERANAIGGCDVPLVCPGGILPAGGCDAWQYDASTIEACEAEIADYEDCRDLTELGCVVTAVPTGATCASPSGVGGEAGSGSLGPGGSN